MNHSYAALRRTVALLGPRRSRLALALLPGSAAAKPDKGQKAKVRKGKVVNVMTRNLYLGAD